MFPLRGDLMSFTVKLPSKLRARLEALARAQRRPVEALTVEAIQHYVDKAEGRGGALGHFSEEWADFTQPSHPAPIEIPPSNHKSPARSRHEPSVVKSGWPETPPSIAKEAAFERFITAVDLGQTLASPRSRTDIDAHIRWLRNDD